MFLNDRYAFSRRGSRVTAWVALRRGPIAGAVAVAGTEAAVIAFGTARGWGLSGSPAAVAGWCAAALAVALIVAVTFRRRWFHPLSLPLVVVAVMSVAAPLWAQVTHEPAGLIYSPGLVPPGESLGVSVSARAGAALVLVVTGYLAGAVTVLAVTRTAVLGAARPAFRRRSMRNAGFVLLGAGAIAQSMVTTSTSGAPYGANSLTYGLTSLLSATAATFALAGLAVADAASDGRACRLRDLLRGREWAALGLYLGAVAASGQRAGLITAGVYLAWAYSTRVRAIPWRWAAAVLIVVLWGGAAIAHNRAGDGLSPGTPPVVAANAVGDVSSPAWLTQETVMHVPASAPYLRGSTYVAEIEAQLPGPVSRRLGVTSGAASTVFRGLIGFWNPNQGYAESFPSEAYLNFGLPGCLGAGLFLGAVTGWAWRKRRNTVARPRDLLYPVLLAGLVYGYRSDALTQIKDVLYPMVIVWAVMTWCRMETMYPARQPKPARREAVTESR